jgi:hypothetical protein
VPYCLGHSNEVHGISGGDRDGERSRIGVVFRCEPHQAPRDVERIFAGLDHPREPARSHRVAVAHRLVERRDQAVKFLAALS